MDPTLELAHARALATLGNAQTPFDKIRRGRALMNQATTMERVVSDLVRREVSAVRATGATWAEIADRTGVSTGELLAFVRE